MADWQQLWSIELNGDWVLPQTTDELKYLPVWPHPEYAKRVSTTRYPDSNLREISSEAFLGHWLPVFEENNVKIAVFPNEDWVFWVMKAKDVAEALSDEIALYKS